MPNMMMLAIPDDPELLAAIAMVAIAHGHHELILKRTLKTLNDWPLADADAGTKFWSVSRVRDCIEEDATRRLGGNSPEVVQIVDILARSEALSNRRNDLMHGIWGRELDGGDRHLGDEGWTLPTASALRELAAQLSTLTNELNAARLDTWLAEALRRSPNAARTARAVLQAPRPRVRRN